MIEKPHSARDDVDREIARALQGADPVGDDEPEREVYETRLHSLRDAVVAMEDQALPRGE